MSEKKISPGLKSALDLGPVVLFFLAFFFLKHLALPAPFSIK